MPKEIIALSHKILGNPEKITIKPTQKTAERVDQSLYFVSKKSKPKLLVHLLESESVESALVFSRTKHGADKIVRVLRKSGIDAGAIHGNKSQNARQKALGHFKDGSITVLVATDIAARGIDVDELSHVFNYDLPNVAETYVHRIGRTGRAQASGIALSFCDVDEKAYLRDIQKLIDLNIRVVSDHPFNSDGVENAAEVKPIPPGSRNRQMGRSPRGASTARKRSGRWSGQRRSSSHGR
jgi:ATP-dependent RNA helicase RhlE